MPALNVFDVDDAIMQGDAQADEWLREVTEAYEAPAREAQAAALWSQVLGRMFPGLPAQAAEEQIKAVDPKAFEEIKRRFMEGMKNGTTER